MLLKANFANPAGALWPGALVAVALQLDVEHNVLVVPASAVQTGQSGNVVWIVDSARKAHVVKVTVIRGTDSLAVLAGGVTPGQLAVTDGQLRLTDGARVSLRGEDRAGGRGDSTRRNAAIDSSRTDGRRGAP